MRSATLPRREEGFVLEFNENAGKTTNTVVSDKTTEIFNRLLF